MRRTVLTGLAAIIALSTSACSLVGGSDEPSDPPPSAPPASAPVSAPASAPVPEPASQTPSTSATPAGPTPTDPDQPAGADQLGQPVATRESADGGKKVRMTLYPVVRDGSVSHLNLTLSASGKGVDRVQVSSLLTDGNPEAGDSSSLTADGLQLVDGKNAKLYLVASDGQGQCLCSRSLSSVFLGDDAPVIISATFAAPPADVTAVDVRVPTFGTVKGVPVQ